MTECPAPTESQPIEAGGVRLAMALAGNLLAAAWIFGGAAFFFLRLGAIVYSDNREFLDGVAGQLGLSR